jgi:hypothetical protein
MTAALEKTFAQASRLPKAAQVQLAEQMLEDLDGEAHWDRTLTQSQPLLEKMAPGARSRSTPSKSSKNSSSGLANRNAVEKCLDRHPRSKETRSAAEPMRVNPNNPKQRVPRPNLVANEMLRGDRFDGLNILGIVCGNH